MKVKEKLLIGIDPNVARKKLELLSRESKAVLLDEEFGGPSFIKKADLYVSFEKETYKLFYSNPFLGYEKYENYVAFISFENEAIRIDVRLKKYMRYRGMGLMFMFGIIFFLLRDDFGGIMFLILFVIIIILQIRDRKRFVNHLIDLIKQ